MAFLNSSGGTLTLPSPTSVHQVDPISVRSLRRSLSRSPTKFHLARTSSQASHTSDSSASSFQIPSPDSPCPQPQLSYAGNALSAAASSTSSISSTSSNSILAGETVPQSTSLFSTPLRSGVRLSLRSTRPKTATSKPVTRLRASPKSPLKRALSVNADMGNATTTPISTSVPLMAMTEPVLGKENNKFSNFLLSFGSVARNASDKSSRHSMHLDLSGDARPETTTSVSPRKRSDATTDFDQASFGSPVAKRRSLHGFSGVGSDLNAFDFASPNPIQTPRTSFEAQTSFEIHDDIKQPDAHPISISTTPSPTPAVEPVFTTTPTTSSKRASTLRKSTLQQRHDPRSSWGRRQGEKYLAQQLQQQQQLQEQQQQQQQLQQQQLEQPQEDEPEMSRRSSGEWLFSASHIRSKPRASLDQLLKPEPRESPFKIKSALPNSSQHVLDRTMAATGVPTGPRPHPLSRTLTTSSSNSSLPDDSPTHFPVQPPPERSRPTSIFTRSLPLNAHRPRQDSVSTPQYKLARPLQSVFASAGLVSKMNRNAEDDAPQPLGGRPMIMPDTPCKKQVYPSNTYPPSSGSGSRKRQSQRRFFFSASTGASTDTPFSSTKPRDASADDTHENVVNFFKLRTSHARRGSILSIDGDVSDSQGAADAFDLPPTPTKSVLTKNIFGSASKDRDRPFASRSLNSSIFTPVAHDPISIATRQTSTPRESPCSSFSSGRLSPKTPHESSIFHNPDFASNMAPPDPSRLSISNAAKDTFHNPSTSTRLSPVTFPPATPTADREAFAHFVDRRVSITPVHGHGSAPNDADAVLTHMFGKVDLVGRGEFSQVFRVTSRRDSDNTPMDYFSATPTKRASTNTHSASPSAAKVFAVKKIRLPFFGQKERQAKLREVAALEAVRDQENVLQIFDHWEQNGHLYIQTEFCEEGGMDKFLKKVGENGRLDDFRIWKILLEVSQGLRYVHDAGYIHLDLKPANILVTYEGHLKIGDFGLATEWPAPKGIEGEGDREYIGPEILQGKYDKPSDIFSLGLIVLEIACNVFLPDNGPVWVALREGDMSVVPSLTAGEANALARDSAGMPIIDDDGLSQDVFNLRDSLDLASADESASRPFDFGRSRFASASIFGRLPPKVIGAEHPPEFMVDQHSSGSLDSVVSWLINPDPASRPTVHQILEIDSLRWVHARRRAPATIFEGNWGPEEDEMGATPIGADIEMMDV